MASEQQATWHPVAQHHPHDGGHSGQDGRDYGMACGIKPHPEHVERGHDGEKAEHLLGCGNIGHDPGAVPRQLQHKRGAEHDEPG